MTVRSHRRLRTVLTAALASAALGVAGALVVASPAAASDIVVTSSADSGPGSLREAVAGASAGDVIGFDPSVTAISLVSTITMPAGIEINGGYHLVLSPASGVTALTIAPTAADQDYVIQALELSGTTDSRGILVQSGTNAARDVTLSQLSVHGFTNSEGSGIDITAVTGTVLVNGSTLSGNTATGAGGSALRYTAPSGVALIIMNTAVNDNQSTSTSVVADGAIGVEGSPAASITLRSDSFSGNQAGGHAPPPYNLVMGGAVSLGNDNGSSGPLTVVDSEFTGNGVGDATHGNVYYGGALHASRAASVTMTGTAFESNAARDAGSAFVLDNTSGAITLTGVNVDGGSFHDGGGTGLGGGFFANNSGTTTISGMSASGNSGGDGSALEIRNQSGRFAVSGSSFLSNASERGSVYFESVASAVTISDSSFTQDSSTGAGAADLSAASVSATGSLTVTGSTFSESTNTSAAVTGLAVDVPTVTGSIAIAECTFDETDAVPVIRVGAVDGTFALANSTIVAGLGVNVGVINGTLARVSHTIVQVPAAVPALTVDAAGTGPSLDVRWSLLSSGLGVHQTDTAGNQLNTDAQLATLADNGGPTLTLLPQAGSPAIDAGDPAFSDPVTLDQRGLPRIVRVIDIGAVEVQAPTELSATGVPISGGMVAAMLLLLLGAGLVLARRSLS